MKRIFLAALIAMPAACASVSVDEPTPSLAANSVQPVRFVKVAAHTVTVTAADIQIPVIDTNLSFQKNAPALISPAREHVRQLILQAS